MKKVVGKVYNCEEIDNFRDLVERTVKKYPEKVAYKYKEFKNKKEFEYVQKTYEEFYNDIRALSTSLLELGIEGKKVALIGENSYCWCTTYLAVTTGNMVVVPLDKALSKKELKNLLIRSEAEAIIFDEKFKDIVLETKLEGKSDLKYLICMNSKKKYKDAITYEKFLQRGRKLLDKGNNIYDNVVVDPNKMSVQLFTSGTTSEPKAVMLSQKNICSAAVGTACCAKCSPSDTLLSFLPLHHTFECTLTFLYGIYYGVTVAFCDGLRYIQQNLKEYQVTIFVAVPLVLETMYKKIIKGIEDKGKTKLIKKLSRISKILLKCKIDMRKIFFKQINDNFGGHLRAVFYGAAPMDKKTIIGYNDLGIDLYQGYGLTETSPVIATETDKDKRPGSVGLPLYNCKIKINDPNSEGIGEVIVKGPMVMLGYYKNEEETQKAIRDGWFYTGDYGYIDEDGFLFITGRKKETIVLNNGKNVYPQEIEFLINKLPGIVESMVYSREKTKTDTMICAKIVYDKEIFIEKYGEKAEKEYKEIVIKEIKKINEELPIYKHVKDIILTTEPLIKTTTQKIKRFEEMKKINAK